VIKRSARFTERKTLRTQFKLQCKEHELIQEPTQLKQDKYFLTICFIDNTSKFVTFAFSHVDNSNIKFDKQNTLES